MRLPSKFSYAKLAAQCSDLPIKVGAVLVDHGNVLRLGHNAWGRGTPGTWTRHAEFRATMNINAHGKDIYVYRQNQLTGAPAMAKPCANCREVLTALGVRKVFYTVPGGYEMEKL